MVSPDDVEAEDSVIEEMVKTVLIRNQDKIHLTKPDKNYYN